MKIVQAHNFYQITGGEDTVVASEKKLLEDNGHEVITYYKHNDEIQNYSTSQKIGLLKKTTWSANTLVEFKRVLKESRADVCHVHNFLPLISPSIFEACSELNIPVVLTLHNYRLICTNGLFLRENKICEDCMGKSAYGSVRKKCYRNSVVQTYAVARMIEKNKKAGTWQSKVDSFICLTDFAKNKFEEHGLPKSKLMVKPNFISSPLLEKDTEVEKYFLFVGRITASKGVDLIKMVAKFLNYPIYMIGEGDLEQSFENEKGIRLLGKKSYEETQGFIANAEALVVPSIWYEGMPMTILEAFSQKTPVIASDIGGIASMIQHKENGLLFKTNSGDAFKAQLEYAINNPSEMEVISDQAFQKFNDLYSSKSNYQQLLDIYNRVIQDKLK